MHDSVQNWVTSIVNSYKISELSTLEIGSLDINGTVRGNFTGLYIGIDFQIGDNVDKIMNAHALEFDDKSFDVVVCTEMLEHDSKFWKSLAEMGRVLKKDGYLIITTRGNGFPEHSYPEDYWRFMPNSAKLIAGLAGCRLEAYLSDPEVSGIFVMGIKV
jgi:SAM-dependent methyltransferase